MGRWEEEQHKNRYKDEGSAAEETTVKEVEGNRRRRAKEGNLHESGDGREEQDNREIGKQGYEIVKLLGGLVVQEAVKADSTDPVWIIPNIVIEAGPMDIRGSSSTLTGSEEAQCVTLVEADATLHGW
jgi:hypothetical protein